MNAVVFHHIHPAVSNHIQAISALPPTYNHFHPVFPPIFFTHIFHSLLSLGHFFFTFSGTLFMYSFYTFLHTFLWRCLWHIFCTRLCLVLPWSTVPQTATDWLKCFCIYRPFIGKLLVASYLISSKSLISFENIVMLSLFSTVPAVPGCTCLYLALPRSSIL